MPDFVRLQCLDHGSSSCVGVQLLHRVADVRSDGFGSDRQTSGDLLARQALSKKVEDFSLASGKK